MSNNVAIPYFSFLKQRLIWEMRFNEIVFFCGHKNLLKSWERLSWNIDDEILPSEF